MAKYAAHIAQQAQYIDAIYARGAESFGSMLLTTCNKLITLMQPVQVERKALKYAVHEAQQKLRQAEAASMAAEAACSATGAQKGAIAQALAEARYCPHNDAACSCKQCPRLDIFAASEAAYSTTGAQEGTIAQALANARYCPQADALLGTGQVAVEAVSRFET